MYSGLDPVGARIWDLIQSPKTVTEIRVILLKEYAMAPEHFERDLLVLLQSLAAEGLTEVKNGASA